MKYTPLAADVEHLFYIIIIIINYYLSRKRCIIPFITSTDGIPEKNGMLSGNSFKGTSSDVIDEPSGH